MVVSCVGLFLRPAPVSMVDHGESLHIRLGAAGTETRAPDLPRNSEAT